MDIIIASSLAVAGLLCLLYFRSLARLFAAFMTTRFRESYGEYAIEHGWDNPNSKCNKYFYRASLSLSVFSTDHGIHRFLWTN
jgi:hypothetical protein